MAKRGAFIGPAVKNAQRRLEVKAEREAQRNRDAKKGSAK